MVALISVLLAITLFGLFLVAGLNSMNTNSVKSSTYVSEIELATTSVVGTIENFKTTNGFNLADTDWKTTLGNDYGNIPSMSFKSDWYYKVDGDDRYVCLVAKDVTAVNGSFDKISSKYPNEYTFENKCQETPEQDTIAVSYTF